MATVHVVKSGETLSLIASKYGVKSYLDIYSHPSNAAFRAKRPNPDKILPGDQINIPTEIGTASTWPGAAPPRFTMQINGKTYEGTKDELNAVVDACISQVVKTSMPAAKRALEIARTEYQVIRDLIDSDPFVAHTLDILTEIFMPGDLTPSADAINEAESNLKNVETAIARRFIPKIIHEMEKFQKSANRAIKIYRNARMKLTSSAETSVPVLEFTRDASFLVLSVAAAIYTGGGATAAAPAVLTSTGAKLGVQGLISAVQAGASETGIYIAGSKSQNGLTATANIGTAFVSSVVIGAIFKHPKIQEVLGKLAYRIAPKISPQQLGITLIKTGTINKFLKNFFEDAGKEPLKAAWTEATKAATGQRSFDKMSDDVMDKSVGSGGETLKSAFVEWLINKGIAKKIITK